MVLVNSTTKGLAAMTLAIAHSRGWLDYEAPVCSYWPEFAQNGKETITVRQLLGHQAFTHSRVSAFPIISLMRIEGLYKARESTSAADRGPILARTRIERS